MQHDVYVGDRRYRIVRYHTIMAYISVGLTIEARDALRSATTELTTPVGRRLTMSDVVLHSLVVARRHESELVAGLADDGTQARA